MNYEGGYTSTDGSTGFLAEETSRFESVKQAKGLRTRLKDIALVIGIAVVAILAWRAFSTFIGLNPGSIQGQVSDFNGDPMPAVAITLAETDFSTATDGDGQFRLSSISPGKYHLLVEGTSSGLTIPVQIDRCEEVNLSDITLYHP